MDALITVTARHNRRKIDIDPNTVATIAQRGGSRGDRVCLVFDTHPVTVLDVMDDLESLYEKFYAAGDSRAAFFPEDLTPEDLWRLIE